MKKTFKIVKKMIPKFNNYLIKQFRKKQIDSFIPKIDSIFRNIEKLINQDSFKYLGYRIVSPSERALYELCNNNLYKKSLNILKNELILVGFKFLSYDEKYEIFLFLPYTYEYFIYINNTKYILSYIIAERLFYRISEGINIKIKLPINFKGYSISKLFISEEGYKLYDSIINIWIHDSRMKKKATVMHYLISRFGFSGILNHFGLSDSIKITNKPIQEFGWINFDITPKTIPQIKETFGRSKINPTFEKDRILFKKNDKELIIQRIYLSVKSSELESNYICKRVASSILQIINLSNIYYTKEDLTTSSTIWKLFLGRLLYSKTNNFLIKSHIDNHIRSLDSYVDENSFAKLSSINIKTVWNLMFYVFTEFERIMNSLRNNDLFNQKVDLTDTIIENIFVIPLYNRIYQDLNSSEYKNKFISEIKRYMKSMMIKNIYRVDNAKNFDEHNDNMLIPLLKGIDSILVKNSLLSSGKLFKFNASFPIAKSNNYFSSSNPARNSILNPYGTIDENGNIVLKNKELLERLKVLTNSNEINFKTSNSGKGSNEYV